jgi:hypothetical protein
MLRIKNYRIIRDDIYEKLCQLTPFDNVVTPNSLRKVQGLLPSLNIRQLRRVLEEEPSVLETLASKSYVHENGFYKLTVIDKSNAKLRVRIHYWPARGVAPAQIENIHNHRFNYYSYILSGGISNRIWKVASNGATYQHYQYRPRMQKQSYVLDYRGESLLEECEERQYHSGDLYCMNAEDLHVASAYQFNDVVTLFIEERATLRPYADVFSNEYPNKNVPIASPALTSKQYLEVLSTIANVLENDAHVVSRG